MSQPLSPVVACKFADSAYATRASLDPNRDAAERAGVGPRTAFDIDNASVFDGQSGVGAVSKFGYCAFGKSADRAGECVIAVRGTVTGADWLTDGRFAADRGPNGFGVHRGFNKVANSIYPQIMDAMKGKNPQTIHLVGHSLGGSTATILADMLHGVADIKLYTFGAPRAGFADHAAYLTSALKPHNIYRVYHDTDPIPMVPIFPYAHCPSGDTGMLLRGSGMIIWPWAHKLGQYERNCAGAWNSMNTLDHRGFSLKTVDSVLEKAGTVPGGFLSAALMRLIVKALGMILKAAGVVIGLALLGAATIADQIAYALLHSPAIIGSTADMLQNLVRQIMRFLGIAVTGTISMTKAFLQWLIEKLMTTIVSIAQQAVRDQA